MLECECGERLCLSAYALKRKGEGHLIARWAYGA
jgi:hypothetical protein